MNRVTRILNVPNILTIIRISAIPFVLYFLLRDKETSIPLELQTLSTFTFGRIATIIFAAAGITDLLDGYLARRYNQVSNFGKLMDPLADKILVTATLLCLVHMQRIEWWLVVLILIREMSVSTLRALAADEGLIVEAAQLGKYKQLLLMIGIGALMVHGRFLFPNTVIVGRMSIYLGLISSYISFFEYLKKYHRALKANNKSL